MRKRKLLVFILCVLISAMPLSACKSKKEGSNQTELKETESKEEEYEIDDDSYQTFETLLQNLAEGLNEGDAIRIKKAFVGEKYLVNS